MKDFPTCRSKALFGIIGKYARMGNISKAMGFNDDSDFKRFKQDSLDNAFPLDAWVEMFNVACSLPCLGGLYLMTVDAGIDVPLVVIPHLPRFGGIEFNHDTVLSWDEKNVLCTNETYGVVIIQRSMFEVKPAQGLN